MIWKIETIGVELMVEGITENLRLQASIARRIAGLAQSDPAHERLVHLQRQIECAESAANKLWEDLVGRNHERV